ncbi:MAG TPA: phosphoribosylanthranilate isomerase [Steroidobacteraceae bacterium]|nr:phosphoribosylanthranilate isomerase [Steroidobacteraceae bacterium]
MNDVPLWIKVCGLRTVEAVEAAVEAGADAVGFVFHAASPRNLELETARSLAGVVPSSVARVAVFMHPAQALLDAAVEAVHPEWVQTDAGDLPRLRVPPGVRVLPVYRTGAAIASESIRDRRFLLESARSGAGERADWNAAAAVPRVGEMVLAGGLDAGNVGEAIATVRPFGVDVSSGVERQRGIKDPALIRAFVSTARKMGTLRISDGSREACK